MVIFRILLDGFFSLQKCFYFLISHSEEHRLLTALVILSQSELSHMISLICLHPCCLLIPVVSNCNDISDSVKVVKR